MTGMEYMDAIVAGEMPPPPIAVTMRMRPIELGEGRAVFEGEPGEEHYNPIGVVHGGYAATLLDSALGCAVHTTLPAGVGYTSLGLEAKYVRPITRDTGRVLCEANVLYRGRRQATAEANLTAAESGKLLAHGSRHLHDPRRLRARSGRETRGPGRPAGGRRSRWRRCRCTRGRRPRRCRRCRGGPRASRRRTPRGRSRRRSCPPCASRRRW